MKRLDHKSLKLEDKNVEKNEMTVRDCMMNTCRCIVLLLKGAVNHTAINFVFWKQDVQNSGCIIIIWYGCEDA